MVKFHSSFYDAHSGVYMGEAETNIGLYKGEYISECFIPGREYKGTHWQYFESEAVFRHCLHNWNRTPQYHQYTFVSCERINPPHVPNYQI